MHRTHDAVTLRRRTLVAFLALLVFVIASLASAGSAYGISQDTTLSRAQRRIDKPVRYSQSKYYAGYRTDCSGYVSMCWQTGTSWNTRTFYKVTHRIPAAALRPGDALLKKNYHIRLFYGWLDEAHTQYISYESAYGIIAGTRIHSIADDLRFGYVPVRYDRISSSPKSRNLLRNPTFSVWAKSWSSAAEEPMWWQVTGPTWGTFATHRKDVYRSARNSLELLNPSADPKQFTMLSQTATVAPGASYRLGAWAKTASAPSGIELGLAYLDGTGKTLAEKKLTGNAVGIDDTAFRQMSVQATAPPGAVWARVTVRLAGGSVTTSAGVDPGASVLLDDVSLARPYVSVGIKSSRTVAYSGRTAVVSGSVWPARAAGAPAVVYVKRPGSSWKKLTTTTIYASGSSAAWKRSFTFTRKMPRGTYRFRTYVPAIPGYLGDTSKTVSIKLR